MLTTTMPNPVTVDFIAKAGGPVITFAQGRFFIGTLLKKNI